jgi:hypothetical protein
MKKHLMLVIGMLVSSTFPVVSFAASTNDTLTASALFDICAHASKETKQAHEFAEQTCISYFRGMTDGIAVMQGLRDGGTPVCIPSGTPVDVARARKLFTDWLRSHPEKGDSSAGLAATFSIVWAYDCKN